MASHGLKMFIAFIYTTTERLKGCDSNRRDAAVVNFIKSVCHHDVRADLEGPEPLLDRLADGLRALALLATAYGQPVAAHVLAKLRRAQGGKGQGIDPPAYRLRAGGYRTRFRLDEETFRVLRVRNRLEAYR